MPCEASLGYTVGSRQPGLQNETSSRHTDNDDDRKHRRGRTGKERRLSTETVVTCRHGGGGAGHLPALGRPREVDPESEVSFVCTARPCFKSQNRISVSVQFYSKHHDHKKVAMTFRGRIPSRPVRVTHHRAMATQGIQSLENLVSHFIFY